MCCRQNFGLIDIIYGFPSFGRGWGGVVSSGLEGFWGFGCVTWLEDLLLRTVPLLQEPPGRTLLLHYYFRTARFISPEPLTDGGG